MKLIIFAINSTIASLATLAIHAVSPLRLGEFIIIALLVLNSFYLLHVQHEKYMERYK